jgi:hypothetical protein
MGSSWTDSESGPNCLPSSCATSVTPGKTNAVQMQLPLRSGCLDVQHVMLEHSPRRREATDLAFEVDVADTTFSHDHGPLPNNCCISQPGRIIFADRRTGTPHHPSPHPDLQHHVLGDPDLQPVLSITTHAAVTFFSFPARCFWTALPPAPIAGRYSTVAVRPAIPASSALLPAAPLSQPADRARAAGTKIRNAAARRVTPPQVTARRVMVGSDRARRTGGDGRGPHGGPRPLHSVKAGL